MLRRLFNLPLALALAMLLAVAAGVAAGVTAALPSPYYIITPGGAYELGPRLRLPEERRREMGRLAFTAVYARPGSWLDVLRARRSRAAEVVPAEEIRPPGISQEQVNETNRRLIDESKPVAAVVALRAAGYDVQISGQGAQVEDVIPGMPADGVLRTGDIVVAVDGVQVQTAPALVEIVRRRQVGDVVALAIVRDGQGQEVRVGTRSSPTEPGRPVVGVTVTTRLFDVQLPFPVDVESDSVGGPSAGLMFSLAILDAVTDGDLTRGYYVAGTGTIATDGSVGPVGGGAEKAVAAEEAGAAIFLVPRENYDDARRGVRSLRLVPVDRFADAVDALCSLPPQAGASATLPTPCATGLAGGLN